MEIVAATKNKNKIREISAILEPFGFQVISRDEAGVPDFEVEEDGNTFEENSRKKALAIYRYCGRPTIADDSGLEVDYLNGAPGVHSARFAGEDGNDAANNEKLLKLMENVPLEKRGGRFVSVISMVLSEQDIIVARGECEGTIMFQTEGTNGFGYDPLFAPMGYDRSFGVLSPELKNTISHRARALKNLEEVLEKRGLQP